MALSLPATNIQLTLLRHAAAVMTALKFSGCKVLMKLLRVEVSEAVGGLL
jgi:hypothetical protein